MLERTIAYFDRPGKANTDDTIRIARRRVDELGIPQVVVASTHGSTAQKASEAFNGTGVKIIAVSINASFGQQGWTMSGSERTSLERLGIRVLTSPHSLGDDVNSAFGVPSPNAVVREALYTFCQGMKVAIEIVLMAADAGLLDMSQEVAAIAGSTEGADTALIVRPTYSRAFQKLRIREILAKPR